MRKKLLAAFIVAAGVAFTGYNMMQAKNDKNTLSDLFTTNVEALAMGESGSGHKYETKEEKTIEVIDDKTGTYQKLTVIDCQGSGSMDC